MTLGTHDDSRRSKIVLVTGASSGIGEATARRLASAGHHVVLAARRLDRLDTIVDAIRADGGSAESVLLDVTDRRGVASVVDAVVDRHSRIDVLVNNAGVMLLSNLDALLVDEWDRMIDTNVRGPLYGIAAVLPHFQRQRSGHVVTVASVGAHEVVGTSAVYSATKYAAWALTEGLRLESDPSLRVTTITPGVVETELATHITDPNAQEAMLTYRRSLLSAETIAGAIAFAVDQPDDVDVNEIVVRPVAQR